MKTSACMSNDNKINVISIAHINVINITPLELVSSKHAEDEIIPNISTVFENLTKYRSQKNQSCKVDLAQRGLNGNTILDFI